LVVRLVNFTLFAFANVNRVLWLSLMSYTDVLRGQNIRDHASANQAL